MRVRDLACRYTAERSSLLPLPSEDLSGGGVLLLLSASSSGKDIARLSVSWEGDTLLLDSEETVGAIALHLADRELLTDALEILLERMSEEERALVGESFARAREESDRSATERRKEEEEENLVADHFLLSVCTYLALLALLEKGEFWKEMPFSFSLPVRVESGNTLNTNMFSYLSAPFSLARQACLSRREPGVAARLLNSSLSFFAVYGPYFGEGPLLEDQLQRATLEALVGYGEVVGESMNELRRLYGTARERLETLATSTADKASEGVRDLDKRIAAAGSLLSDVSSSARNSLLKMSEHARRRNFDLDKEIERATTELKLKGKEIASSLEEIARKRRLLVHEECIRVYSGLRRRYEKRCERLTRRTARRCKKICRQFGTRAAGEISRTLSGADASLGPSLSFGFVEKRREGPREEIRLRKAERKIRQVEEKLGVVESECERSVLWFKGMKVLGQDVSLERRVGHLAERVDGLGEVIDALSARLDRLETKEERSGRSTEEKIEARLLEETVPEEREKKDEEYSSLDPLAYSESRLARALPFL